MFFLNTWFWVTGPAIVIYHYLDDFFILNLNMCVFFGGGGGIFSFQMFSVLHQKFGICTIFMFLSEYLLISEYLLAIYNIGFLFECTLKYNLFQNFHHSSSLQCHVIFRNHNNMLIYYECCNSSYCFWNIWYFFLWWIQSLKEYLFKILIFYNNRSLYYDLLLFNTSLLNKNINKKKKFTDPKLLNSIVYCNTTLFRF